MFNLFSKMHRNAPTQPSGRCAETLMPLVVAGLGQYADDCLRLSFAMVRGQADAPRLDVIELSHIETLRQWLAMAPAEAQHATEDFVRRYQLQSTRFKAWIAAYNGSRRDAYAAMTQEERDCALVQDTGGAVRATLELRRAIEALWLHVTPTAQPVPHGTQWLESKFLYCNERPENWSVSCKLFVEIFEEK